MAARGHLEWCAFAPIQYGFRRARGRCFEPNYPDVARKNRIGAILYIDLL